MAKSPTSIEIAVLNTKLDTLIDAQQRGNEVMATLMKTISEHQTQLALHAQRFDNMDARHNNLSDDVHQEVGELRGRVNTLGGLNFLSAGIAGLVGWFKQ